MKDSLGQVRVTSSRWWWIELVVINSRGLDLSSWYRGSKLLRLNSTRKPHQTEVGNMSWRGLDLSGWCWLGWNCLGLPQVASGCLRLPQVASGCLWLPQVASGCLRLPQIASYSLLPGFVPSSLVRCTLLVTGMLFRPPIFTPKNFFPSTSILLPYLQGLLG